MPIPIMIFVSIVLMAVIIGLVVFNLKVCWVIKVLKKADNLQEEQIKTLLHLRTPYEINEYWSKSILKRPRSDLELKLLQNQTTVRMLQSQINPHFLYNTLDCIRGEALLQGADDLATMTKALSSFFSYSISKSGTLVTIRDELQNVKNYFLIQQFRFNRRFILEMDYDSKDFEIMNNLIPRLTLQPIIENSISHGFSAKTDDCRITLSMEKSDRKIYVRCSDNGIGMSAHQLEEITEKLRVGREDLLETPEDGGDVHGLGLANISNRIRLLMGESYGLQIFSMENVGTDIVVCLPKQDKMVDNI